MRSSSGLMETDTEMTSALRLNETDGLRRPSAVAGSDGRRVLVHGGRAGTLRVRVPTPNLASALALRQPECQPSPRPRSRAGGWGRGARRRRAADQPRGTQPAGRRCLTTTSAPPSPMGERLRRSGHSPDLVAAALTQSRLRTKAAAALGASRERRCSRTSCSTPDGAEQATRPAVAALRAERFRRLGPAASVADLGCGVGLDALALAEAGPLVDAYDRDADDRRSRRANARRRRSARADQRAPTADVTPLPRGDLVAVRRRVRRPGATPERTAPDAARELVTAAVVGARPAR